MAPGTRCALAHYLLCPVVADMCEAIEVPWLKNGIREKLPENEIDCVLAALVIDATYHTFNHARRAGTEFSEVFRTFRARFVKMARLSCIPNECFRSALRSDQLAYVRFVAEV